MLVSNTKIILADDDIEDVVFFEDVLTELSFMGLLITVNSGQHLMETLLLSTYKPNIIFIDYNMPNKNGLECLKEIKGNDLIKDTPVIMMSGIASGDLIDDMYNAGAHFFLQKPSTPEQLKEKVKRIISAFLNFNPPIPSRNSFCI